MSNYTPEVGALIKAGSMLANCAFNLEQIERLTLRERRSLDESRKAWDEAHSAYAATLRQQAGRVDEDARDAVAKAIADVIGHGMREKCYAHADAVLAALAQNTQGDGEAVLLTLDSGFQIPIVRKGEGFVVDPRFPTISHTERARVLELARALVDTIDNECERVTSDAVWAAKERLQEQLAAAPSQRAEVDRG